MLKFLIDVSPANEGTDSPWWVIIDPRQMMSPDAGSVGDMVTGPFFSREDAQEHLEARSHAFTSRAVVYCMTGYWSGQYKRKWREADAAAAQDVNALTKREAHVMRHALGLDHRGNKSYRNYFVVRISHVDLSILRGLVGRGLMTEQFDMANSVFSVTSAGRKALGLPSRVSGVEEP